VIPRVIPERIAVSLRATRRLMSYLLG
jgi:hypothetical protein